MVLVWDGALRPEAIAQMFAPAETAAVHLARIIPGKSREYWRELHVGRSSLFDIAIFWFPTSCHSYRDPQCIACKDSKIGLWRYAPRIPAAEVFNYMWRDVWT